VLLSNTNSSSSSGVDKDDEYVHKVNDENNNHDNDAITTNR
jgi:hypothetical protein